MKKRSGKFYNKNEKQVMQLLGLKPTIASGSGWLEKEDGYNENVICQLKSTDSNSIKVDLLDIEKLEYQATVTNKIPVFAIQFLKNISDIDQGTYLLVRPSDLKDLVGYISEPYTPIDNKFKFNLVDSEVTDDKPKIVSTNKAKQKWKKEQEQKWKGRK